MTLRDGLFAGVAFGLCASFGGASADDFAVSASPPRFDLSVKPGGLARGVLEIDNAAPTPGKYSVKTADWKLDANAGAVFTEALQPGSCRPWVAIERREISVPSRGAYRFRFEVSPPADAPSGECRFALMIEGAEQNVRTKTGVAFPVSGRLGIIVYVAVGDAKPDLSIVRSLVAPVNGEATPVLEVRNAGAAHGRLAGFLSGTDARGAKLEFQPSTLPILPGETRGIPLVLDHPDEAKPIHIAFPLTIRGKLEWTDHSYPFSASFAP
ncbi:MAG: COG1470 family protein [Caulobacteraceae bacterium]